MKSDCGSWRRRLRLAYTRTIGAAVGAIMAVIITAHMTNISAESTAPHDCIRGMAMSLLMDIPAFMSRARYTMYAQASSVIAAMPTNTEVSSKSV